jgi:hypothetical protein
LWIYLLHGIWRLVTWEKKREFAIFEYLGRNDLFENSISVQLSKLADFLLGRIDLQ